MLHWLNDYVWSFGAEWNAFHPTIPLTRFCTRIKFRLFISERRLRVWNVFFPFIENRMLLNIWMKPFMNVRCARTTKIWNYYECAHTHTHWLFITPGFGFVYCLVYYHKLIMIIICTARISIVLFFIFYDSDSRQCFWLQSNALQYFHTTL